jgi:hypothetical protein
MIRPKYALVLTAIAVLLFLSCSSGPTASGGTGTETGNAFTGRILYPDRSPAAGVTVKFFPVDYVPLGQIPSSIREKTTDADGYYDYSDLGPGMYNVEGEKDSLGVFIDTIIVERDSSKCRVPTGVLDRLGVIKGATAAPESTNLKLHVYFIGTSRYLKPTIGEGFVFDSMPAGPYRIVYDPTLVNYVQQEFDVNLTAGDTLVLDTVILSTHY